MDVTRLFKQKGWSLLELVLVLIVISSIGAVALFRWPATETFDLDAQAAQLRHDIRLTQALAMQRQQRFRINFSSDQYSIRYLNNDPYLHPATGTTDIQLMNNVSLSSTETIIAFSSLGVPYTDAVLPGTLLTSSAVITLSGGGQTRQVTIAPRTGLAQ